MWVDLIVYYFGTVLDLEPRGSQRFVLEINLYSGLDRGIVALCPVITKLLSTCMVLERRIRINLQVQESNFITLPKLTPTAVNPCTGICGFL